MTEQEMNLFPFCGYAPGPYMNKCVKCAQEFLGGKMAYRCLPCSIIYGQEWVDSIKAFQEKNPQQYRFNPQSPKP